jgi:hypothetical protein
MMPGRYRRGLVLARIMFEGIWSRRYPMKKMETARE